MVRECRITDRVSLKGKEKGPYRKEEKMAEKKLVEAITSMSEDFAQWYTDVVKKAELIDYSNVNKACRVCYLGEYPKAAG